MKNSNDFNKIVSSAKNGNKKAFDKLYELTHQDVWFTCISLMKHEENAKDIFQDTYLTAFEKIGTLEDCENFPCWIKRIAANKCKDFLKSKVEYQLEEEYTNDFIETDELLIPEKYVTNNEKRKIIVQLMEEALTYVQYQTVFMYYFSNMTVADIAQLMECSESTVKSRLSLARTKMKKAITDYEEENNDRLHGVVLLPFFSSVFKTESESLKVPAIKLNLPAVAGKKGFDIFTTGILSTTKSKAIAGACVLAFVCGVATTTLFLTTGCGSNKENTIATEVTTEPTETVPKGISDIVKENNLKVDKDGNIIKDGEKLQVRKDGTVEVKDADGKKVTVKVDDVKDVVNNGGVVSKPTTPKETQPTTKKPSTQKDEKETQKETKKPETQKPTQKPETQKPTQPATKKPTQNTTQDPHEGKTWHEAEYKYIKHPAVTKEVNHPAETKTVYHPAETKEEPVYEEKYCLICNSCGLDITDMYKSAEFNVYSDFDAHMDAHKANGEKTSWHSEYRQVQTGTKTVTVKKAWTETVVTKKAWTETVVVEKEWTEKVLVKEAGWY